MQVSNDSKMSLDVEEYVTSFRTDLCDALAAWSKGGKFADIMKMTDVFEVQPHRRLFVQKEKLEFVIPKRS